MGTAKLVGKNRRENFFEIYRQTPEAFEPFLELDKKYHTRKVLKRDKSKTITVTRKMFRGNKSTEDIINEAKNYISKETRLFEQLDLDLSSGCEESCEVYSEEHLAVMGKYE